MSLANTMKQYGRINDQKAHDHEKERQDVGLAGYGETKAFFWTIPSPRRDKRKKTCTQKLMHPPHHKG